LLEQAEKLNQIAKLKERQSKNNEFKKNQAVLILVDSVKIKLKVFENINKG
jgi:hypothetical protein